MQKKNFENKCASNFYENVRFLGKTQNFQARCGRFSHDPIFFLSSKVLEGLKYAKKKATKRISKNVVFQATLLATPVHLLYGMPHPRSLKCSLNFALTLEYSFIHNLVSFDMTYSEYARKLQLRKILY
jgi:hypothetical protein